MSQSKMAGMLYGLALGDALGYKVEFFDLPKIKVLYGSRGIADLPEPALYSDDSQMTFALAEALLDVPATADMDTIMAAVGQRFLAWGDTQKIPEQRRAPGITCMNGLDNFRNGMSWRTSGLAHSKGCGAAMRVAPIGLLYQHDETRLIEVARASAVITHRHPTGVVSAIAAAYAVRLALDNVPFEQFFSRLAAITSGMSDEMDAAFARVGHVAGWTNEEDALAHIGEGWVGEEAVALALYCVLRYPDDYLACVRRGANITGDSDSVACIAGGIMGARYGLDCIPPAWIEKCESTEYIRDLGERLSQRMGYTAT